ncbi:PLP-dependent aminotransferase family protein [Flexivirga oryzae]|uniref:DNA-binding transcriptional MocR family regulator n=1 Tax=Flexivirga oryzae TaxID=1794944 RepID=A0A839N5S9_9MICO|nr:aminotransferase class I/II-fold pyridoxal phosphate-dependent enzyme [Flexivirga oryzae]MBB2890996.1 DNA-binding transcriptional MocR family regulator [Flexivirga oryzae]
MSALEERLTEPNARGLTAAVIAAIRDGVLVPGERLPPIRTVATQLALSPTTVSSAWSVLARSGTIRTDGRRGTTVADTRNSAGALRYQHAVQPRAEFALDLSTGVPDPALLPDLAPALRALGRSASTPATYLDDPILPALVEQFAADWPYPAEAFTLSDGAMDGIDLIARTLLSFGDRVVVEHPGFPPLLDLLDALGAELVGVALDDEGMRPDDLASALRTHTAAVFLQPRAQNPTGISISPTRAERLAQILGEHSTLVVEDDSAGAVAIAPAVSLGSWLPEQTLHLRSFSKSHGPDLRLAGISGPSELIGRLSARRQLGQGWTSRLLQHTLLHLLTDTDAVDRVAVARNEYARRRASAVRQLEEAGVPVAGDDGLNLWIPVADETAAIVRLASQGIGVAPGAPFGVLPDQPGHIRVTIGLVDPDTTPVVEQLAQAATVTGGWGRAR